MSTEIKALILDADGVVQHPTLGWLAGWVRLGGPSFLREVSEQENRTLTGEEDLAPLITDLLARKGLDLTFEQVMEHWCTIDVDHRMLELADRVRAEGALTALGTNQNPYRGQYMLDHLPYADHFDAVFHSWQIGHAKPEPAFFHHVVDALGIRPDQAVFVDDVPANVAGARAVGLHGVHFSWLDTYGELRAKLRALGTPGL